MMANKGEPSNPSGISLEKAHEMKRDKAITKLEEQVRKLTMELEWVKGSEQRGPCHCELDVSLIDISNSSSHEDYDDKDIRERRHLRDDLSDLKIEAPKFDGNLKPKNYLDWVQAIKRTFEFKEYNDENAFELAISKMKWYASLWYEN